MSRVAFDFCVPPEHPALPGHFPGRPLVPGVLLLDHVLQSVSALTGQRVTSLRHVKFISALLPGELARSSCEVDGARVSFRVVARRQDADVVVAEGVGVLTVGVPS